MSVSLGQSVEIFIENFCKNNQEWNRYRIRSKRDQKAAERLMLGERNPTRWVLIKQEEILKRLHLPITDPDMLMAIPDAIEASMGCYTGNHNKAVSVYKDYLAFLDETYGVKPHVDLPPVFDSQFDRQMYIIKCLHNQNYNARQLSQKTWVDERTIRKDMQQLEDGITVLGQGLRIMRDDIAYMRQNTIHPIFLTANLTQIVYLLRGLELQAQDKVCEVYVTRLAASIWGELSDYARDRIMEVSGMMNLNTAWFGKLDNYSEQNLYATEADCSYSAGAGNIMNFLKNSKKCVLEYVTENGKKIMTDCMIIEHHPDESITVLHQDRKIVLPIDAVINCTEILIY